MWIILDVRKEIMKSLHTIKCLSYEFTLFFSKTSFIFPYYYHYYCYYYFISVWLLVKVRKEDKNGKRCVHPLLNSDREAGTKTSRVGGKQGGRPARKRYQLVANRLAERSKPYSARLTGKRRQTDQKTQKLHEHIHPGIGHSAVKPL